MIILLLIYFFYYVNYNIFMNIIQLPKDLNNICCSYLTGDEYLYVNNEWTKFKKNKACNIAAENGWLDLLIWAKLNGYEWDSWTCSYAASNGHLEVIKWARQNGCEWDSAVCSCAAWNGHLEVLKWAKLNGCVCGGKYHNEL